MKKKDTKIQTLSYSEQERRSVCTRKTLPVHEKESPETSKKRWTERNKNVLYNAR